MSSPLTLALDKRTKPKFGSAFIRARKVEEGYARQLRKIARHIGDLVSTMWQPNDPGAVNQINDALERYSNLLEPWATAVGSKMIAEVAARDKRAWGEMSREMGRLLRREIADAPTGQVMRDRLADQVDLIKSLPRDAAERVHKLTLEGIVQGTRAETLAKEIMRSGEVSKSRANLIARTETARTATELTRARAEFIGSTHYTWRTAHDSDVRPSHKKLDGKVFAWTDPPECDPGVYAAPGSSYNCRCIAIPIIDD